MFNHANKPMHPSKVATSVTLGLMLLFCLVATASGGDDRLEKKKDRTLTGSWNLTTVLFDKELHAMVTFFEDGTFIHTGASTNNVNAHGIWKRIGSRTFYEENREYVYQNSELALFADTKEVIELSKDGMTLVGEAKTELKTLDGTVVDVVDFTIYGTRMTFGR